LDVLDCLAIFSRKGGAESFVATHHLGNGGLQVFALQRTGKAQPALHVVDRLARFELLEKPEALLREGERRADGVPPPETARMRASAGFGMAKPFGDESLPTRFPCENWFRDRHGSWVK
jgi:hypothetical protein